MQNGSTRQLKLGLALGVMLALVLNLAGPRVYAQLQQSGGPGSTVTLAAGSALAGKVGIDQTTPGTTNAMALSTLGSTTVLTGNGVTGAGSQRVTIASDNTAFSVNAAATQSGTWTVQPGNTANTTAWFVKSVPVTACGVTVFNQDLAAVPTSTGSPTSTTTCLMRAYFNNTNASAQTVTLTDNTGTPLNVVGAAFSVPGLSNMVIPFDGIRFNAGIKWVAGGTGIVGGMWGYQ